MRLATRIETVANVTLIICCVLIAYTFLEQHSARKLKPQLQPPIAAGLKLTLQDLDFSKSDKTLVIALQQGCHFCSASMPFYKRLTERTSHKTGRRIVAIFANDATEGKRYLAQHDVLMSDVRQVSLSTLNVSGTPTLILVNRRGTVENVWVGQLSSNQEAEVISKLL